MPTFMLCWGILAMLNAVAKNFAGACAVRFFLGMFEGKASIFIAFFLSVVFNDRK